MIKDINLITGIEVHVELTTQSKMFCGCPADHFGKAPNTQTCPVCLALPGALPVPNQKAIEETIKIGLALNCEINHVSKFDRKQYFYPDLAKGYQISQYDQPLCINGFVMLDSGKKIRIERIHLEEDTGKLQHTTLDGEKVSLIDFNRSGVPLVEIVSMPDISSSVEAKEYLKKIHQVIREIGISTADLEKGQMRLEPTVNLKIIDEKGDHYTPLAELKNINSFNFAVAAIEFEKKRQLSEFEKTGVEKNKSNKSTRGYDSVRKVTFPQRQKEEAKDYRYFPEPDIPPLLISDTLINKIRASLPQLPEAIKGELVGQGIDSRFADIIVKNKQMLFLVKELSSDSEVDIKKLASLLANKKIVLSENVAEVKAAYLKSLETGVTDTDKLTEFIEAALKSNPQAIEDYRNGKSNALGYFVGQVMKLSQGKADPKVVSSLLIKKLL